jgi:hypothetical protein
VDALSDFVNGNIWLSGGVFALWVGTIIWVLTGFTNRGWTTQKQRDRQDAREKDRTDMLLTERKETADKALEALGTVTETNASQQGTISEMDKFFRKVPIRTPSSGDTGPTAAEVTK